MSSFNKSFDRKLRCDDIPGAQPKIRHYDRRPVRNYPNQMMASISQDEEQNVIKYMNEQIVNDEKKYQTYRHVVDNSEKINQAIENIQANGQNASIRNLKAIHSNLSKNIGQNQSSFMNIADHQEQYYKNKDNNNNQSALINNQQPDSIKQIAEQSPNLSQSRYSKTPPKNINKNAQEQNFYNLDYYNGDLSGEKPILLQQSVQIDSNQYPKHQRTQNQLNASRYDQNIIDENGSKILRQAYGDNIYRQNFSDQKFTNSQSVDRFGGIQEDKAYFSDNILQKKKFNQNISGQNQGYSQLYNFNQKLNTQQQQQLLPKIQSQNLQDQMNQIQQNQKQRKRILSYNIITNNSVNYLCNDKLTNLPNQFPSINNQKTQSYSVERFNQYEKLQNHPQQDNPSFVINYILPTSQNIDQNPFRPEQITEKKIQFNRKKLFMY
ncbi:hypothetical protein TTHERM_00564030 (macronuclear) [Tetrahymena thermophila SB210]|uniref:Uncharacterized protein n=1 Tax=Tetrahymena thermophila (strain SB210) TaxID=312017 RepID=I7MLC6_TETTS|nr:hypothetical protein TTHERM_00564030 [Tetrahymena thermophila SB210]EAS01757.2 hypothetical protein TTHERM_00564030 [Tetrahymena thermophila SB210]|eukprot:XP_001022002.2 hypothetical protein TTHERM_00564030 [Tetrahymena thermophila SB210]